LSPCTTWKTPGGRPASRNSSPSQCGAGRPQRDHRREVERRDAGDHAERLTQRVDVDAGARALGVLTLQQVRDADGELDHLDAALNVALGIREGLAVFAGEQSGEFVDVLIDEVHELHHHAGPALRIPRRPVLLGLRRAGDGGVDVGRGRHRHRGLHLPGVGVHHVGGALGPSGRALAVDEMRNLCGHELAPRPNG
jgi:hypothetical protein